MPSAGAKTILLFCVIIINVLINISYNLVH